MLASLRRLPAALALGLVFFVAGMFGVVSSAVAADGGSGTPSVPTSTVGVMGEHFVRYCVQNYGPESSVSVTNELTGDSVSLTANHAGAGCAEVPIERACRSVTQTITATGTDASGDPATSSAVVTTPPTASLCSVAASGGKRHVTSRGPFTSHGSTSSGSLAFTGAAGITFMVIIGTLLIVIGSAAVAAARRRGATRAL